jgi:hypothetical protein
MSWLFSRALVEESLAANFSEAESSVLLSGMPTAPAYWSRGKQTDPYDLSQFGMTCERLTEDLGAELLTLFRAGFRAKSTAAHLEGAAWRKTSGRSSSGSWQMSLRGLSLPRTSHAEQSRPQPTTSRRWVSLPDALPFQRKTWVLTTFGSATGFLHTPTHTANYACKSMQKWPNCREFVRVFGKPSPTNHEWLMGWPIGWTDLRPLATGKFQAWQSLHFLNSPDLSKEAA